MYTIEGMQIDVNAPNSDVGYMLITAPDGERIFIYLSKSDAANLESKIQELYEMLEET